MGDLVGIKYDIFDEWKKNSIFFYGRGGGLYLLDIE